MLAALLLLYVLVNGGLFAQAAHHHAQLGHNLFIQVARGTGACLNLNAALVLLPMMRGSLTWFRGAMAESVACSLYRATQFHVVVGHVLLGLSVLHSAAHALNYSLVDSAGSVGANLFETRIGVTGLALLGMISLVWLTSIRRRASGRRFRLFTSMHAVAIGWLLLAVFHGPRTIGWIALPVLAYAGDRLVRRSQACAVVGADVFGNSLVRLEIKRPSGFDYLPGDYVKIRVAAVSRFEWHPFTITSHPVTQETLTVHVRRLGGWTHRLAAFVQRAGAPFIVNVRGPFPAPSNRVLRSRRAVLIANGIGITAFVAILVSLLQPDTRARLKHMRLRRTDVIWVCREHEVLGWFRELLIQVSRAYPWVTINLHFTGRTAPIPGVQVGRPDWDQVFGDLTARYRGRTDVFFCGSEELATSLRRLSRKHGFDFARETF